MFHVSSTANRQSIQDHGLDWTRMGAAPGIAGSRAPDTAGIFLVSDYPMALFFVDLNNTGGPVDIWAVDGVPLGDLLANAAGFSYVPYRIDRDRLTLHGQGLVSAAPRAAADGSSTGSSPVGTLVSPGDRAGRTALYSAAGLDATSKELRFFPRPGPA